MPFVYHYHATKQLSPGNIVNIDGLLLVKDPIVNMERYRSVKALIIKDQLPGRGDELTVTNLSLLHELADRPAGWDEEVPA